MIRLFVYLVSIFLGAGCISASISPTPRFYMLHTKDKAATSQKFNMPQEVIIEVGPVVIPQYLDRPQIVTYDKNKMLVFAQFDRWGELLDEGIERSITENLTLMLPGASIQMFPCNFSIPLSYQLIIDIVKLDCDLDGNLYLVAQWSIINAQNKRMVLTKHSELSLPIDPHNYSGLVGVLESAVVSLSAEIAQAFSALPHPGKISEGI